MFQSKKIKELIGVKVKEKNEKTVYAGQHAGKKNYLLDIEVENRPEIKKIGVYKERLGQAGEMGGEEMWKTIENTDYADKRFVFYYQMDKYGYTLVGWKELTNK